MHTLCYDLSMETDFEFDPEKDAVLCRERGIGFEEIIACLMEDGAVDVTLHHNLKKYPNQFVYHVDIEGYVWLVPAEKRGKTIRLITAYPSRKATKKQKGTSHEKNKKI